MKSGSILNVGKSELMNNCLKFSYPLFVCLIVVSCSPHQETKDSQSILTQTPSILVMSTQTSEPSSTPIPSTPTPELIKTVCSPLEGETLNSISEILTQSFKMPRSGNDDGHQGVDFSFYRRNERVGIEGLQVFAALEGKVITILHDRAPYGNAVIIETPLDSLNSDLISQFQLPAIQPTVVPDPRVNCPPGELNFSVDKEKKSLYLLYGHLLNAVSLSPGEDVKCGQQIGLVGNTGYSTNPHLHFETRLGPSGARFDSMAYYIAQSTVSERYNYCVWRVSNLFQLFDPMNLLSPHE
jgi:murein DD-endopeptidase MepM/ murein hydrolase activator NlpD